MKTNYIYTFILLLFLSCGQKNVKLENALALAGENRAELEKVLHHYSRDKSDSLKLKAAEFLIENMPGHYTLEGELINKYREKIDKDTIGSYFAKKILDISLGQIEGIRDLSRKKEDIQHIKANFLIRHIDLSFEQLNNYPWLTDIPFDMFIEHVLPYRFENERLDLWRDSLFVTPECLKNIQALDYSGKYIISNTNRVILSDTQNLSPLLVQDIFQRDIYRECNHIVLKDKFLSLLSGSPLAIDQIPHYANRNGFHCWISIISPERKEYSMLHSYKSKTAKVYRKTFSRNNVIIPHEGEYIPELFKEPFYKDVTDLYLHTSDVVIYMNKKITDTPRHAYLCVFNNLAWQPIDIGEPERDRIDFKNMGKGIVYLPACYKQKTLHPVNYPFILNLKGEIKYLVPDTCTRQTLHLTRKYPVAMGLHLSSKEYENFKITAANHPAFHDTDTITTRMSSAITYHYHVPEARESYQYWCLTSEQGKGIAEIAFINTHG